MPCSQPILELPLHLLTMVLAQLDSMESLGSAILSHSLFYSSFRDDSKHIVQCILKNQIPPELVNYAEAAFKIKFVKNEYGSDFQFLLQPIYEAFDRKHDGVPFREGCLDWIFEQHFFGTTVPNTSRRHQDSRSYSSMSAISIADAISRTHDHVDYFCERFVRERLPLMEKLVGRQLRTEDRSPSHMELFRIRRALYRYQIYCNLFFRDEVDFHPGKWVRQSRNAHLDYYILSPFPPWVNEQLSCVHDYLEEVLSRTFDDVASHDIVWGALSVDWLAQSRRNGHKQAFVSARHCMDIVRRSG